MPLTPSMEEQSGAEPRGPSAWRYHERILGRVAEMTHSISLRFSSPFRPPSTVNTVRPPGGTLILGSW